MPVQELPMSYFYSDISMDVYDKKGMKRVSL